jgi:hypothetical protein
MTTFERDLLVVRTLLGVWVGYVGIRIGQGWADWPGVVVIGVSIWIGGVLCVPGLRALVQYVKDCPHA